MSSFQIGIIIYPDFDLNSTNLIKGNYIDRGAFGDVYEGQLILDLENKLEIAMITVQNIVCIAPFNWRTLRSNNAHFSPTHAYVFRFPA